MSQLPGGDWDRILEDAIVSSYETMLASVWWRLQLLPSVRAARSKQHGPSLHCRV